MRKILVLALLLLPFAAWAQVQFFLPPTSPEDLLQWVRNSTLPTQQKEIWLRILPGALEKGLVDPAKAKVFFERLVGTPPSFISEITAVMGDLIEQGLPVTHLMNKVSQGITMGRNWTVIENEIRLRAAMLVATHSRLSPLRPPAEVNASVSVRVGSMEIRAHTPTWEDVEVEVAEAIGDFIAGGGDIHDWGGMESLVRTRLQQLRGRGLTPYLVDRALEVLNSQLIGAIVSQAFQLERR